MKDKINAEDVLKLMLENEEMKQEIDRQSKAQVILDNENAELNYKIMKSIQYIEEKMELTKECPQELLKILRGE